MKSQFYMLDYFWAWEQYVPGLLKLRVTVHWKIIFFLSHSYLTLLHVEI